jgi:hypothetical protein
MSLILILILIALCGGWSKAIFEPLGELCASLGKLLLWVVAIPVAAVGLVACVGSSKPHYKSKHFPHYDPMDTVIACAGLFIALMLCLCFFW